MLGRLAAQLKMPRPDAYRPRATALLGAAEARHPPPGPGFAKHRRFSGEVGSTQASSLRAAARAKRAVRVQRGLDARVAPLLPKEPPAPAQARAGARRRASAAPSIAGRVARARSAHRELTRRACLNAASASERSELCAGATRPRCAGAGRAAPRTSRSEAPTGARPRLCSHPTVVKSISNGNKAPAANVCWFISSAPSQMSNSSRAGSSSASLMATRPSTASRPSMMRWS